MERVAEENFFSHGQEAKGEKERERFHGSISYLHLANFLPLGCLLSVAPS